MSTQLTAEQEQEQVRSLQQARLLCATPGCNQALHAGVVTLVSQIREAAAHPPIMLATQSSSEWQLRRAMAEQVVAQLEERAAAFKAAANGIEFVPLALVNFVCVHCGAIWETTTFRPKTEDFP